MAEKAEIMMFLIVFQSLLSRFPDKWLLVSCSLEGLVRFAQSQICPSPRIG